MPAKTRRNPNICCGLLAKKFDREGWLTALHTTRCYTGRQHGRTPRRLRLGYRMVFVSSSINHKGSHRQGYQNATYFEVHKYP